MIADLFTATVTGPLIYLSCIFIRPQFIAFRSWTNIVATNMFTYLDPGKTVFFIRQNFKRDVIAAFSLKTKRSTLEFTAPNGRVCILFLLSRCIKTQQLHRDKKLRDAKKNNIKRSREENLLAIVSFDVAKRTKTVEQRTDCERRQKEFDHFYFWNWKGDYIDGP